ncbi:MAG: subclass B3 metallo-beta-lactamase [Gammaproteobacteria bacterium]|nr:subclass B3 metallo-beta-lactamase [Gammaproteobacteria bacterium]
MKQSLVLLLLACVLAACGPRELQPDADFECSNCDDWNKPLAPFRVYGNTWYVGMDGLSALLIETSEGLVLIDGGLPQSAVQIDANVRAIGFDPEDIQAILVSHPHFDHAGGIAALQRLSGAPVYISAAGAAVLRTGKLQENDPQFGYGAENTSFAAVKNVHDVEDRGVVSVANVDITAIHTPGHTPGGTSWTWESCALDACYTIVYADSLTAVSAPGFRFTENDAAAQMLDSIATLSRLDCDILLSPHPFFFGLHDKLEKREDGNPFVNNVACALYGETMLGWLEQRLDSEG